MTDLNMKKQCQYPINGSALKSAIKRRAYIKVLAKRVGIQKSSISQWILKERIPFESLVLLRSKLEFSHDEMREIFAPTLDSLGL